MGFLLRGLVFFLFVATAFNAGAAESLKGFNVKPGETTVSGLSSGAFMAHQLHVAHSDVIQGAGIFAGGSYYCAEGSATKATGRCTCFTKASLDKLYGSSPCDRTFGGLSEPTSASALSYARRFADSGDIADLKNLADDKVFLMIGDKDAVVLPQSMKAVQEFYTALGLKPEQIAFPPLPGNHTFPTLTEGKPCGKLESPYIGKCDLDGAGKMLTHLLGPLNPKADQVSGTLTAFDQNEFAPAKDARAISLGATGYVFVPQSCAAGEACRLHVALHGCGQSAEALRGTRYPDATGYREWADANRLIVLFPQTQSRLDMIGGTINPEGCWDWWGYATTGGERARMLYGTRKGPQVIAIRAMIDRVTAGK